MKINQLKTRGTMTDYSRRMFQDHNKSMDELIAETFDIERVDKDIAHRHYTATRILIECGIKEPKPQQTS